MPTTNQYASQLIRIAVANQPTYIYNQLRALGYNNNQFLPTGQELESDLYSLYATDKNTFYSVLTNLPFDSTKTDAINSSAELQDLASNLGIYNSSSSAKFNFAQLWQGVVEAIGGKETVVVAPIETITTGISTGAVIGLSVVAILAVVILYFAFFKK